MRKNEEERCRGIKQDDMIKMPSPTKITTTDLLNSRTPSPNNLQMSKKQLHIMSSATNNGFLRGSSPPLLNSFENLSESKQQSPLLENRNDINNFNNQMPLLDNRSDLNLKQSPLLESINDFHQSPHAEHRGSELNYKSNNFETVLSDFNFKSMTDSRTDLLPRMDIVVFDNHDFDFDNKKESSAENFEKEGLLTNHEFLKLEELRIRENPLINVTVAPTNGGTLPNESPKVRYSSMSKQKPSSSPSKKRSRHSWLRRRSTPLEKYLACTVIILILCFSIILLAFFNKPECLGLEKKVCLTEECVRTAASLLAAMNLTADPCVDFFQFACGTWNKKHVIPEDKSSISTFEVLADQLQVILKGVLEEPFNKQDSSATKKAKLFYKSCMNVQQIRKIGDAPLREVLQKLGGWPVATPDWKPPSFSIETLLGRLRGEYNEGVLVEQWVGPDDKNSSVHILQLDQMQLALPSRDYYLKTSSEGDLKAYHRYMTQVAVLLGANATTAEDELEEVVQFEKQLANATLPEADRHDTSAIYRKLPLTQLQKEVPELNWKEYLSAFLDTKIEDDEPMVSYAMPYFTEMGHIISKTDRRVIHNYVLWRLIMNIMPHMIDEYQQKRIEFRKILLGILSERHRWSQCVEWTNKKLGMAVGALFIRDNFNHDSKETALEMIHTIREAFNELLAENVWMDDETRAVAKEKADAMNERIGYPELLTNPEELSKEYINLNVTEDQFLVNILNVLRYDAYHNLQKLRQPVNKDKWSTEPAVVNAFYNPNKNDIVFPAGILQPLFYSQHFPKSLNYGGIGVVIGHEITHGFDDKGRQFDKDGNMMQWWNNATIRAFRDRTQCIIDQYSRYKLDDINLHVNGRMTQGENIADNGGLKQSFRAYKKWVAKHGEEPLLPGINLTHDQLFFLNYAQIWCGSMRPEDALTKIRSSVHSPGPIRVLGPLSNSWDFAKAYDCPPMSPMNPTNKCSVW